VRVDVEGFALRHPSRGSEPDARYGHETAMPVDTIRHEVLAVSAVLDALPGVTDAQNTLRAENSVDVRLVTTPSDPGTEQLGSFSPHGI
jgi:hypothetical protein